MGFFYHELFLMMRDKNESFPLQKTSDYNKESNDKEEAILEKFTPMRNVILNCVRDDSDFPNAYRWLYKYHTLNLQNI